MLIKWIKNDTGLMLEHKGEIIRFFVFKGHKNGARIAIDAPKEIPIIPIANDRKKEDGNVSRNNKN